MTDTTNERWPGWPVVTLFKNKFAIVVDGVLTSTECWDLIEMSEKQGHYETALLNGGTRGDYKNTNYRNSLRYLHFDRELADSLFTKIVEYMPREIDGCPISCLNERLSFLKYYPHQFFKPHYDGVYTRPDLSESSRVTVQLYLTDNSESDGGGTTFLKDPENGIFRDFTVYPKQGRMLAFEHNLLHEGSELKHGRKYCIRTDVMYKHPSVITKPDRHARLEGNHKVAAQMYDEAAELELHGKTAEAVILYRKATKLFPEIHAYFCVREHRPPATPASHQEREVKESERLAFEIQNWLQKRRQEK